MTPIKMHPVRQRQSPELKALFSSVNCKHNHVTLLKVPASTSGERNLASPMLASENLIRAKVSK